MNTAAQSKNGSGRKKTNEEPSSLLRASLSEASEALLNVKATINDTLSNIATHLGEGIEAVRETGYESLTEVTKAMRRDAPRLAASVSDAAAAGYNVASVSASTLETELEMLLMQGRRLIVHHPIAALSAAFAAGWFLMRRKHNRCKVIENNQPIAKA